MDRFLKKYLDAAPLSLIYKLIRKDIKVNGKRASEETLLVTGDEVTLYMDEEKLSKLQKPPKVVRAKKQFSVIYEDENILVVNKPFGLLTHGDKNEKKNHLANQVIDYLIQKGDYNPRLDPTFSPAPVNRLDRNTTGLVVFGKNAPALQELNKMIRGKNRIRKFYVTIVGGKPEKQLILRDKMTKNEDLNMIRVVPLENEDGKIMETVVTPLETERFGGQWYTFVEVEIVTGRTHQIRAHLAKEGFPVIGDTKYGSRQINRAVSQSFELNTHLLHARRIVFEDCDEAGILNYLQDKSFTAALPPDFERIKRKIFGNK